ncbi:thermonuclease family protein [Candidatus Methanocrinis natronophilus]|uniref:Thermonuclease family protein n=1 Tax=Candidatus Methanocrinis natronophilus TaxID=3033396 RepID=A0ABT5XAL9_9EURY|nr:thermonuclease family protein [Candidatus Methanocrinis natronophilus]MDF0591738.1 thermonuclease family protein [Candidatus Methanocrinis natronophilus]
MRLKPILALLVLASLLPILAAAAPDEASGIVTNVVDGDTFDLRIDKTDPRIIYEIERVRLADVDSPEMSTPEGRPAKVFATDTLLGQKVWLDIDDKSRDGRDPYGRLIAVVYLEDPDGTINTTHPFNRLLVDAGHAIVKDFTNNEFDPAAWWEEGIPQPELSPVPDTTTAAKGGQFVGSVRSDKYHYPSCKWGRSIASHNEIWFSSSQEARAAGYVPCGACKPP